MLISRTSLCEISLCAVLSSGDSLPDSQEKEDWQVILVTLKSVVGNSCLWNSQCAIVQNILRTAPESISCVCLHRAGRPVSTLCNDPQRYPGPNSWNLWVLPYEAKGTLQMWLKDLAAEAVMVYVLASLTKGRGPGSNIISGRVCEQTFQMRLTLELVDSEK